MAKQRGGPPIPFESLCDGYSLAVANAFELLTSSLQLIDRPSVGLALAELGQEELGKSLSILAATSLSSDPANWSWFWSTWRNHVVKAHRAFLYELVNPVRLEAHSPDGTRLAGASFRASLPTEKDVGIYVAYDSQNEMFVAPSAAVGPIEAYHRATTLLYLGLTARAVLKALESRPDRTWYRLFGEVAFRICSEELYQQQMPQVFAEFRARSGQHAELIETLNVFLEDARKELAELVEGGKKLAESRKRSDA